MRKGMLLVVLLSLAFAPAPLAKPDPTKSEMKKLEGSWVRVRCTFNGNPMDTAGGIVAVITGNRLQYVQNGAPSTDWALTIDARKKPKVFDIQGITPTIKTFTYLGVYELKGDTLIVSSRRTTNEKERPTDFDGGKKGVYIEVFERRKR